MFALEEKIKELQRENKNLRKLAIKLLRNNRNLRKSEKTGIYEDSDWIHVEITGIHEVFMMWEWGDLRWLVIREAFDVSIREIGWITIIVLEICFDGYYDSVRPLTVILRGFS